jgi:hypothetical protein
MTLRELKKVQDLVGYRVWEAVHDELGFLKKSQRYKDKADAIMNELVDSACSHDWKRLGRSSLVECGICKTRRWMPIEEAVNASS